MLSWLRMDSMKRMILGHRVRERRVKNELTTKARQMVKRTVSTNIPENPIRRSVFRPAFSTRTNEIKVISTFIEPMPNVLYWAASSES